MPATRDLVRAPASALRPLLLLALLVCAATAAHAQPFSAWMVLTGDPTNGWVEVADNAAFDITGPFTFEAWVAVSNNVSGEDCRRE